jgi:hypothetical protein
MAQGSAVGPGIELRRERQPQVFGFPFAVQSKVVDDAGDQSSIVGAQFELGSLEVSCHYRSDKAVGIVYFQLVMSAMRSSEPNQVRVLALRYSKSSLRPAEALR